MGQRLSLLNAPDTVEIVGVVASVKQGGLLFDDDLPELYLPFAQSPRGIRGRHRADGRGSGRADRGGRSRPFFQLDPTVPVSDIETMQSRMAQFGGQSTRFSSFLATAASMFAI